MADRMSVVPYCDPYDNPSCRYDCLHFILANDNPTLDFLSPVNQQPPSSFPPQPNDDVVGDVSHSDDVFVRNLFTDDSISSQLNEAGPSHANVETFNEVPTKRSNLSQQRERVRKLRLKDFEEYFHLPVKEAARRLNLCPTVVRNICRRDGLPRWPHRKIQSFQRQIASPNALSNSTQAEKRSRARANAS